MEWHGNGQFVLSRRDLVPAHMRAFAIRQRIQKSAVQLACVSLLFSSAPAIHAELTSDVRLFHGLPALFVNGRLTSQILAAPYRPGASNFLDFRRTGNRIYDIYFRFNWTGPESYDFSRLDRLLSNYLELDPDALFIGRILLTPGAWFAKQFPDEVSRRDDGSLAGMFGARGHPSFSSRVYRDLSHQAMIALISHLEARFGDNIVGYQVGNGFGGEWLPFNSFWEVRPGQPPPARFGVEDYSPAARADFRSWLRAKYQEEAALRRAWGDSKVTFESAEPPNEKVRYSTPHGIFFDPAISSQVPDFFQFYNHSVAAVLMENAAWVKELVHRKKIVGAFYGYLWCNFPNLSAVHSGHLGLTQVLRCPDVDFLASPYTYDNKYVDGPNNSQSLPEAAQLHGKLYFNELDTETFVTQRQWRWGDSLNVPKNWEETRGLLIRDFGYSFTKGFGLWWTDLFGGTFHDDKVLQLLSDLRRIDDESLDADKTSVAEIAVVLDESGFRYCGDGEPLFNALLTAQKQWQLGFIGAPWEPHLLSDISNPKLKDFKLYIFLNTFHVTPAQRDAIHARLKRNGATAVWVYAPGYISDQLSVENMTALTGIKLAESDTTGELHVDIADVDHPYTKSLPKGFAYGTDVNVPDIIRYYDHRIYLKDPRDPSLRRDLPGFRISPRFYADDPEATVLGELAGVEKPGLVVKKQPGWTSVYSSAPILPAELLRNIAREAGCHIYSDANDVVYANRQFLCIYAPGGKTRTVRLPERANVIDALDGKTLAENVSAFPLTLAADSAVLLRLTAPAPGRTTVAAPPRVRIETDLGNIIAQLAAAAAPITVSNFLRYTKDGFFDGGRFFRTVTLSNQPNDDVKIQVIQAESPPERDADLYPPIPLERTRDTGLHHLDGTLSMARDGPDTAQSSFSICVGDQPELDFGGKRNPDGQGFAAFGRVIEGMDVVRKIHASPANGQRLAPPVRILRIVRVN